MAHAEVGFSTGRYFLSVAGVIVAAEGDKCRDILPESVCEPIPEDELDRAWIGGERAKDVPLHIVRFFRGDSWRKKSLQWAADRINAVIAGTAKPYSQDEAIDECHKGRDR
jgi:hypothetical protein